MFGYELHNLDEIDRDPKPKPYYLTGIIGMGICTEWSSIHYEFINYEVEFYVNNLYIPIEEEVCMMKEMMHFIMYPLKKLILCKLVMWWYIE